MICGWGAGLGGMVFLPAKVVPSGQTIVAPETAIDRSPALDYIDIIHFKKGFAKPPWAGGDKGGPTCYGFISKGAKLTETENLYVNDANSLMASTDVLSGVSNSANTWDTETVSTIFGSYISDSTANFDEGNSPDGKNEISFGKYPQAGVIAVTRIWGIFYGPPQNRYIDQFDILFNTAYSWGNADTNLISVMDFRNIATHEIGHGVGLADIYETGCSAVTMYGYSDYGEIQKRSLEPADIIGLQKLYGI